MAQFFTEFPCKNSIENTAFTECVVTWLKGVQGSTILDKLTECIGTKGDDDEVYVASQSGESLVFRRVEEESGRYAIGFRHELPDEQGHLWRTEAVLRHSDPDSFVTVRVTCLSTEDGTLVLEPKRPYLVKLMLQQAWGADDGDVVVADHPHMISESQLNLASKAVLGEASLLLPTVYVSARQDEEYAVDIDKLAYDLGGIAHVLVEPNRDFSFRLGSGFITSR